MIGEGKLVIPVDFTVRRPDPAGPGRPCRDKLTWLQVMLDRTWAAIQRRCRQLPRIRYVRRTATSPTSGPVTVVIVDEPGQKRYDRLCQAPQLTVPRVSRAWKRRSWLAHHFRLLKHLLATEACQVHGEDAYDGHLGLRLLAGLVLLYTARVLCKGCVTMEKIVFSLKHHWRFLNANNLE